MSLKKVVSVNMVAILMLTKLDTPDLPKIKIFWNKGYDVTVFVDEIISKTLSRDSNYKVYVIMWPKLTVGMALKLYDSVAIELKLKLKNLLGDKSYVCTGYMGNTGREPFWPLIQNRLKLYFSSCVWYQKRCSFYPNVCISQRYITYY